LSIKQYTDIQEWVREYAYAKYPKLERTGKTKDKARAKIRVIDNEIQLKKRTGKQSNKELMKERLQNIFINSKDYQSFITNLQAEKIWLYKRWNTFWFIDEVTNIKYRLNTLELEKEFENISSKFQAKIKDFEKWKNKIKEKEEEKAEELEQLKAIKIKKVYLLTRSPELKQNNTKEKVNNMTLER
jgi:hypothetical protein